MANNLESQVGEVVSVNRSANHTFSKDTVEVIRLLAGLGVELSSRSIAKGIITLTENDRGINKKRPACNRLQRVLCILLLKGGSQTIIKGGLYQSMKMSFHFYYK